MPSPTDLAQQRPVTRRCPACNQPLKDVPFTWNFAARCVIYGDKAVVLDQRQSRIFEYLWQRKQTGQWHQAKNMASFIWDTSDGGPVAPWVNVCQCVRLMNQALEGYPVRVETRVGMNGGYKLAID